MNLAIVGGRTANPRSILLPAQNRGLKPPHIAHTILDVHVLAQVLCTLSACTPLLEAPLPEQNQKSTACEVRDLFRGRGEINLQNFLTASDAFLVVTWEAGQLCDFVYPLHGDWTLNLENLRIAPFPKGKSLGVWLPTRSLHRGPPEPPAWASKEFREAKGVELVSELFVGLPDDLGGHGHLLVGLVHVQSRLPTQLRIVGAEVKGKTLSITIQGAETTEHRDPEIEGFAYMHIVEIRLPFMHSRDGAWKPEGVQVYTNSERGYPGLPLHIRLGDRLLPEPEPALNPARHRRK